MISPSFILDRAGRLSVTLLRGIVMGRIWVHINTGCLAAVVLGGLGLLLLQPGSALAGTWTDDFEDDVLTPPWTGIEGTNTESAGQFHTTGMSSSTHVGPVVETLVAELTGESHVFLSGTVTSNDGGSGFTLKKNASTGDRCGIYIWANGGVWSTHDDSRETLLGQALIGPSANAPTLLAAELDGTTVTLFLYGTAVWSGTVDECDFVGDGTVGLELHQGRTAHWDDFNASWYEADGDGDGYCPGDFCAGAGILPGDCDDSDPANSPGGVEVCDGQDNDCDTLVDDADPDVGLLPSWWTDSDGDGYGDSATEVLVCIQPSGTVGNGDDCDDSSSALSPTQAELCNAIDDDCSGSPAVDEVDLDGDGTMLCAGDCDDDNAFVYPAAAEDCDGLDNDCDGIVPADEADDDGDGVRVCEDDCDDGNNAIYPAANEACDGLDNDCDDALLVTEADLDADGFMVCAGDCNDFNAAVSPGAPEICDGLDNDCDGIVPSDEGDSDSLGSLDCDDGDGDGFTEVDGDCNDTIATVAPGLPELCDTLDNNCDGLVDEGLDSDDDGIADCYDTEVCDGVDNNGDGAIDEGFDLDQDGYTTCGGDCDDDEPLRFPANPELCDGLDSDCDLIIDNAPDEDVDGFGPCDGDCDDTSPLVYPGAVEECDSEADNNCDGIPGNVDDFDEDGLAGCAGDCDDANDTIHPGAEEVCDQIDNNCDDTIDEGFDLDQDGYSTCQEDCDDADAAVFPAAVETCDDAVDLDCDGVLGAEGEDCDPGDDDDSAADDDDDDDSAGDDDDSAGDDGDSSEDAGGVITAGDLPECGCSTVRGAQAAGLDGWLLALLLFAGPLVGRRRRATW